MKMKKVRSKLVLKVLMLEQKKERIFIAEMFLKDCKEDPTLLGWIIMGFQIWSVNAVEEKRRTTAQKISHNSVPTEIDVNFIFRRPRRDKREWVPYWKNVDTAFYIKML